jgi:hypothetical protein
MSQRESESYHPLTVSNCIPIALPLLTHAGQAGHVRWSSLVTSHFPRKLSDK